MGDTDEILSIGDVVSFLVESSGHLAIPSTWEPVPEKTDCVTHLRAIAFHKASDESYPADYSVRLKFVLSAECNHLITINV